MDDIVKQAMLKWPRVPHCFGWLGLDARGNWRMRDERAQAAGGFQSGQAGSKGSVLQHDKLLAFIGRNYAADSAGQWYFQNGPQRVYIDLEVTPWIWRLQPDCSLHSHTGISANATGCLLDEQGRVFLDTNIGFGMVHTMDVGLVADGVARGIWTPEDVISHSLPLRFGYTVCPEAPVQAIG